MSESLKRTPLHALHLELGAKMVPFAGYEMPVQYPLGIMKEHLHTRSQAGLTARVQMFFHDAKRVLHGHFVACKWHHLRTKFQVQRVQGRSFERLTHYFASSRFAWRQCGVLFLNQGRRV